MDLKFWQRQPKIETRSAPYSDAIAAALYTAAAGNEEIGVSATGVQEACAGLWARSFASATVTPSTPKTAALTPSTLAMVGRNLHQNGESVFEIVVDADGVKLLPASSWNITGDRPGAWMYELTIPQPSAILTRYRAGERVLHLQYDSVTSEPWKAAGPGNRAKTTGELNSVLETRLRQEIGSPVGSVVPVPQIEGTTRLQATLKALRGEIVMVPSAAGGWDEPGTEQHGRSDWRVQRLGADPPQVLAQLRADVADQVAAASGIPPALIRADSDATAAREGYRQFISSTIGPIARMIEGELRLKLDEPNLALSFDKLAAADISGRARATQSLVGAGATLADALEATGLMEG